MSCNPTTLPCMLKTFQSSRKKLGNKRSKQKETPHSTSQPIFPYSTPQTMCTLPKPPFHHHHHHLFSLLILLTTSLPTTAVPSDAVSLLKFKLKADINNNLLYNLNERFDYCQWQGVKCVQGRVVRFLLQNHNLTGTFADNTLSNLNQLRVLSLRNNSLTGPIPNLSSLTNLKTLFLDHNLFSGTFPISLLSLHLLQSLDLARNNLSASLPVQLTSLDRITNLRLEFNRFTGSLPPLNQTTLLVFNVSGNNLTGPVPATPTLSKFDASSYLLNPNLCGKIVNKICDKRSPFFDAAAPAPVVENGGAEGLVVAPPGSRKHKRVGKIILGLVIGVFIVVASVAAVVAVLNKRRYGNRTKSVAFSSDDEIGTERHNGTAVAAAVLTDRATAVQVVGKESKGNIKVREQKLELPQQHREKSGNLIFCEGERAMYGLENLMSASAELLGRGTIGTTYKAVMDNQLIVTVKRLDAGKTAVTTGEAFEKHLEAVGGLRHPNLVPVRAYFQAKQERLVIYDYQANGSLFNLIHGSRLTKAKPLHWTSCLKIAEDIALGLAYIHQASRLIHNNLKATNVLLGSDFEACLTDYCLLSLADPTAIDESISAGYKAPELRKSFHRATTKSDVYAFGVLLLELLSGRPPSQHPHLAPEDMAEWVRAMRENDDLLNDKRLEMLVEVAGVCSMTSPEQRPVMRQVLKMLQEIKETASNDDDNTYKGYL